jgi:hypothetical protein
MKHIQIGIKNKEEKMKKITFILFLILSFYSFTFGLPNYWSEIIGGISWHAMSEYNNDIDETKKNFITLGADPKLNQLNQGVNLDFTTCYNISQEIGLAFYIRYGFIIINDMNSYINYSISNSKKFMTLNASFDNSYLGVGMRYYFPKNEKIKNEIEKNLNFFIGGDVSFFGIFSKQYMDFKFYDLNGNSAGNVHWEANNNLFLGVHIETGCDYWFNDWLGAIVKIGYRIASADIVGSATSSGFISSVSSSIVGAQKQKVEYNGIYLLAGINFTMPKEKNK